MMDDQKTAELIRTGSVKEFLDFVRANAGNLVPADSYRGRYRGVRTKDGLTTVVLPLSVIFDDRDRVGEETRRLLTSGTGHLLKVLS